MSNCRFAFTVETLIQLRVVRIFLYAADITCFSKSYGKDLWSSLSEEQETDVLIIQSHDFTLRIPLPEELLIDRRILSIQKRPDHLEVKLRLVAFLKEKNVQLERPSNSPKATRIACGHCRVGLVGDAMRFLPMPFNDWEESADNWFDFQCGCGGPAKAAVLAKKVRARLVPTRGICLVGSTSYLVHKDDLLQNSSPFTARDSSEDLQSSGTGKLDSNSGTSEEAVARSIREQDKDDLVAEGFPVEARTQVADILSEREESLGRQCQAESHAPPEQNGTPDSGRDQGCGHGFGPKTPGPGSEAESRMCCQKSEGTTESACTSEATGGPVEPTEPLPYGHHWLPVRCPGCETTVGVRKSSTDSLLTEASQGVHLFKHHVSLSDGSSFPDDPTPPREALLGHFVARLQEASERSACSHFLVRGLLSGRVFCHVTVLSRETLIWTGHVGQQEGSGRKSRGLKLLLSESTGDEAGGVAGPERQEDCDSVFLLDKDAEVVLEALKANSTRYPPSCRTLNGMSLSFL